MKGKLYCMVARLYEQEQRRLNSEKEEYRSLKSMGSLVIRQKRGNIFFSEKRGRQETGITHDSKRVLLLARKRVLRKSIAHREQLCRACKEFLRQIRAIESLHTVYRRPFQRPFRRPYRHPFRLPSRSSLRRPFCPPSRRPLRLPFAPATRLPARA